MTLWHLLLGMSFFAPFGATLQIGSKLGVVGVFVALVLGIVFAFGNSYGLYLIGEYVGVSIFKLKSYASQTIGIMLLYFGSLIWMGLVSIMASYTMRFLIPLFGLT